MTAYYNEHDPYAAQWLRNLIAAGHIAPGEVDERSVVDVRADDLRGFRQCHFFAGIGVWSYALRLAGWSDDRPVWTGSCPCQPFSDAGAGEGFDDERHLWPYWRPLIVDVVCERGDVPVFGEQVASKAGLAWLDLVHSDLEAAGYAVGAVDLCAAGVGAPEVGQRLYFVGEAGGSGLERHARNGDYRHQSGWLDQIAPRSASATSPVNGWWANAEWIDCSDGLRRCTRPGTFPLAHGATARVGRLRAYGNAINARQAQEFITAYMT